MSKIKYSFLVVSIISIFSLLAACGDTSEEGNASEGVSGELNFYTSQPDADAEKLVSAFNEQYPDVNVRVFRYGTEEVISTSRKKGRSSTSRYV